MSVGVDKRTRGHPPSVWKIMEVCIHIIYIYIFYINIYIYISFLLLSQITCHSIARVALKFLQSIYSLYPTPIHQLLAEPAVG